MKRVYNNYFLVGLFTILVGTITIVLLLKMSGQNKNAETYYSYFDNVTGLGYGNPVYYEGYRVGQIESIAPEVKAGKLLFKTEYTLIQGWKVPKDSVTKIASSGLLSDMSLNITAGIATEHLPVNSEIQGIKGDDIMATMTQLATDLSSLNEDKITPLFDLIYTRVDNITASLETQVPEVLNSLDVLVKNIDNLVLKASNILDDDNIKSIDNIITSLESLSTEISSLGDWIKSSLNNVDNLIVSGQNLIDNSDKKVTSLLDIAIQMLDAFSIKAETIANELESASMNVNEATNIIRRDPSTLVFDKKSKIADEDL